MVKPPPHHHHWSYSGRVSFGQCQRDAWTGMPQVWGCVWLWLVGTVWTSTCQSASWTWKHLHQGVKRDDIDSCINAPMHILNVTYDYSLSNYFASQLTNLFSKWCLLVQMMSKGLSNLLVAETSAALCGLPCEHQSSWKGWKLYSVHRIYQARVGRECFPPYSITWRKTSIKWNM